MGSWIVGAIVFALTALAARKVYKDRKNGKVCGQGCENCASCPGRIQTPRTTAKM